MNIEEIERKSFAFIDQHLDATFYDVPEDLLKIWHISMPIELYLEKKYTELYEFRIFSYALEKYRKEKKMNIPDSKLIPVFRVFQLMLSISSIKKYSSPKEAAFKIFDFQLYLDLI